MAKNNKRVHWEDEEEEENFDYQSSQPSAESYLNEEFVLKNFSQGSDDAESSSNSRLPIGLKLSKTPSFLNSLRESVAQGRLSKPEPIEKLKTGTFPAASIMIGSWKRCSQHEGDLTAKLYYTKRKLVWEVLEGTMKYKIEMNWSDITAIRGIMPENKPGTLEVELSQPPIYFQELDPQPRKHTNWKLASDFTEGQAPVWRRHIVSFKPGILNKHYEKLLECNQRLFELSIKPFPSHKSPYFDPASENSEMSLNLNRSSYYQGRQYPYQQISAPQGVPSPTLPPSIPAMNFPYTNDGLNMQSSHLMTRQQQPLPAIWNQGSAYNNQVYDQNSQYPNIYQPTFVGDMNDTGNHLVGDQSGVPSTHYNLCTTPENVAPWMSVHSTPVDVINSRYDHANAGYQYQYHPATYGLYSDNLPPQQYLDNNVATNFQGGSSSTQNTHNYPDYNPGSSSFF